MSDLPVIARPKNIKKDCAKFEQDLMRLINFHSMENYWDMPDFLMAKLITGFIESSSRTMRRNLEWHGLKSEPNISE